MRTDIEIDDALMSDALAMTGVRTKKEEGSGRAWSQGLRDRCL